MNTLIIKNLNKYFGNTLIFRDFNLKITKGEMVAIVGPSGQGKSTLLRCIAGLEKTTSGSVCIKGNTGLLFQSYNLFANMTVIQNITSALTLVQKKSQSFANKKAEELLTDLNIFDKRNYYPIALSGGQQQRVAIARTLALEPELLLFDEPTSALDSNLKIEIMDLIKFITKQNKCASLIVTHDLALIKKYADRILTIYS